jgi:23S rRNA G2445 N2-methylase RlmL
MGPVLSPDAALRALRSESSDARKEAAAALARMRPSPEIDAALTVALRDTAPKVRKSAAIALAREGNDAAIDALAAALHVEEFEWVRASLILAIGKVRGRAAERVLRDWQPQSDAERDARAKALDRVAEAVDDIAWRTDVVDAPLFASVPRGLEDVAQAEAAALGVASARERAGLLRFAQGTPIRGLLARLRCVHDVRLLVAEGEPLTDDVPRRLASLLRDADWRGWIGSSGGVLRYRFSLDNLDLPKSTFREALSSVRDALQTHALADSPSNYALLLRVQSAPDRTRVWLVPTFEGDQRFAYRKADVGAAIDPVVGASLVRLLRTSTDAQVVDPTCGSGTLLIERALLDAAVTATGLDISPTAVRAATENVIAAGFAARLAVRQADATDGGAWPDSCREVIANLPFGVRSASMDRDLPGVYRGVVANAAARLEKGGRALFYTSAARLMTDELKRNTARLRVVEERTIPSGGIAVRAWLAARR